MGVTPTYNFPYPELTDSPNGPVQIRSAVQAVEDQLEITDAAAGLVPRGIIGGRAITGTNNLGGAITNVLTQPTNMNSGLLSLVANRRYQIHCRYKASATDTTSTFLVQILEDTATAGTTGNQIREYVLITASDIETRDVWAEYETGGSSVSRAFKIVCTRISGAASVQFKGGGTSLTSPVGLWVYDVGAAGKLTQTAS